MHKVTVTCYLRRGDEILLVPKTKKNAFQSWGGFCGRTNKRESSKQTALRVLKDMSGVERGRSELVADVLIHFDGALKHRTSIFFIWCLDEEMRTEPEANQFRWFPVETLPLLQMSALDARLLPILLAGKRVRGFVFFDAHGRHLIESIFEDTTFHS